MASNQIRVLAGHAGDLGWIPSMAKERLPSGQELERR